MLFLSPDRVTLTVLILDFFAFPDLCRESFSLVWGLDSSFPYLACSAEEKWEVSLFLGVYWTYGQANHMGADQNVPSILLTWASNDKNGAGGQSYHLLCD